MRLGASLAIALALPLVHAQEAARKAPLTRADNVKEMLHAVEVVDPYRWLEDQNSPETRARIDAQNAYTQSLIGHLPGREAIDKRLGELLRVDTVGTPSERGGRYFFSKRLAAQDLSVLYMRKGIAGQDEVLVDPHPMSPDHRTSVGFAGVSEDGSLLAYSVRQGGADEISVRFMDVDSRKDLALAYSPYQNVKPGMTYPAVLFITGDGDTRVDPLHARKMAALVQADTGSERPVLLQFDTKAGHSGGCPVNKVIEDTTDELSFLFWQLGVSQ